MDQKNNDRYKILFKESFAKITKRHSKFLGFARPVCSEDEAIFFINKIKNEHRLAKHHVYVYRIYKNNKLKIYESAEPQGSAGLPILDVIKNNEIFDCVIVVVRYFGGVLLGKSSLTSAYRECAKAVISENSIDFINYSFDLELICNYSDYEKIVKVILNMGGRVNKTLFLEEIKLNFRLKKNCFDELCNFLKSFFKKDIVPKITDEGFLR